MKVAIIGGRYRNQMHLTRIAERSGHELEVHEGHLHGVGVQEIRRIISRSDLAVILTSVNSHGAMYVAKEWAKHCGTPTLIVERMGAARFEQLLRRAAVPNASEPARASV